ncbi:MAG: EamA family transporter, partial [Methylococcales bacterium]|nr:EamA family transporter [Methylococcales bacterium]
HTPTSPQILLLLLVGLFGASYQLFITLALKYAIARIVSPIFFSSILYAGILEWLIWHKVPSAVEISGMVIVIVGAIFTISISSSSAHKLNQEPQKHG